MVTQTNVTLRRANEWGERQAESMNTSPLKRKHQIWRGWIIIFGFIRDPLSIRVMTNIHADYKTLSPER
jgi:hypothetical protein